MKMKPVDGKSNTYINSSKEINDKDSKFKTGDIVTISKYKNIFVKDYILNWSEKVFVMINTVPWTWTYVISDLKKREIVGMFYEKELQKTNQKTFRVEKSNKEKRP